MPGSISVKGIFSCCKSKVPMLISFIIKKKESLNRLIDFQNTIQRLESINVRRKTTVDLHSSGTAFFTE